MRFSLFLGAASAAFLSYGLYTLYSVPAFVQDQALVAVIQFMLDASHLLGLAIERLRLAQRETGARVLLQLTLPLPRNSSSVQFTYRQFADSLTLVASHADAGRRSGAGVVFIHGGGWIFGTPEMHCDLAAELVERTGATVFLIRYRLAPEHKFPSAFDDSLAAVEAIFASAQAAGVDADRILVGGDSAGGQLAAAVTQHLLAMPAAADRAPVRPKLLLLVYPVLQVVNLRTQSHIDHGDGLIVKTKGCSRVFSMYLLGNASAEPLLADCRHVTQRVRRVYESAVGKEMPVGKEIPVGKEMPVGKETGPEADAELLKIVEPLLLDSRVSPLLDARLEELPMPRTFVAAAEFDALLDDSTMYAARLRRAGASVQMKVYRTFHGAMGLPRDGSEMRDDIVSFISSWL